MKKLIATAAFVGLLMTGPAYAGQLDVTTSVGSTAHILPTAKSAALNQAQLSAGPLEYHGGPVMLTATIYTIFWAPKTLQTGVSDSMPTGYKSLMENFAADYVGHGIDNNNTQYFQTVTVNPITITQ